MTEMGGYVQRISYKECLRKYSKEDQDNGGIGNGGRTALKRTSEKCVRRWRTEESDSVR